MKVVVLGAGRMGFAVVYDLLQNKEVSHVTVIDAFQEQLDHLEKTFKDSRVKTVKADVSDYALVETLLKGHTVVISCVTYKFNFDLAKAAINAGAHFCDLGGNESIVAQEFTLDEQAKKAGVGIIPDCGLAPGMVSILAAAGCQQLDEVEAIHLRVGGLPSDPQPPLNYALCFSVEGLINEYVEDATVIRDGKQMTVPSLEDVETLEFEAPFGKLEAFNTSGGISTLPKTFAGKVKQLDYKTIRYPGHCAMIHMLKEIGMMDSTPMQIGDTTVRPRAVLAKALESRLPKMRSDVVLLRVIVSGKKDGVQTEIIWECIDEQDPKTGLTAMMRCTAFPVSIIAQMLGTGEIKDRGALFQEQSVPAFKFIAHMQERGVKLKHVERKLVAAR